MFSNFSRDAAGKVKITAVVLVVLVVGGFAFAAWNDDIKSLATADDMTVSRVSPAAGQPQDAAIEQGSETEQEEASTSAFTSLDRKVIGDPSAPVEIIEYASLTCSHCADFHTEILPKLKEDYIDTGKAYLVYQDFPLNAPALQASMVARCLPDSRYFGFIGLLFKTQERWAFNADYLNALRQNAKLAGLNDQAFDACLENESLQQSLALTMQAASKKWEINSTPTFVINGGEEIIRGAKDYSEFKTTLDSILKEQEENTQN